MANLPDETLTTVFKLQQQLLELINQVTAVDFTILDRFGETATTTPAFEQLQNARERLTSSYSRLYTLMLRIAEAQPRANSATLNLLAATIQQTQTMIAAVEASIQEARRDFNLS